MVYWQHPLKNAYIGEYIPTSGLLGYRPLQSNAKDESGNGKDGVWTGTEQYGTVGGKTGALFTRTHYQSWDFASSYITTSLARNTLPITFICWYYDLSGDDWGSAMTNISNSGDNANGFCILTSSGSNVSNLYVDTGGTQNMMSNASGVNTWICVGVTISSGQTKVYKNGQLLQTFSNGANATNYLTWRFGIGKMSGVSRQWGFSGYVRKCAVYDRVLTADEILKYYNVTA